MFMVIMSHIIRIGQTVIRIDLVVNLNFSRIRIGNMMVIPMNEAYPAIITSSCIQPKALDIWYAVGRNTPPLNWNIIAQINDITIHTGVGTFSLKYITLGKCEKSILNQN